MATIKDIAKLSGVGTTTVSRVLNGGNSVKDETIEKVLKVVKKLNYKLNSAARNLKLFKEKVEFVRPIKIF